MAVFLIVAAIIWYLIGFFTYLHLLRKIADITVFVFYMCLLAGVLGPFCLILCVSDFVIIKRYKNKE